MNDHLPIRVLLISDYRLLLRGLIQVIESQGSGFLVNYAETYQQAVVMCQHFSGHIIKQL